MKTCVKCGEAKEFSEFYKRMDSKDGHRSECRPCGKERRRKFKESQVMQLEKQIKSSIITENKILFSEKKRLCCACKNIFLIADLQDGYCRKCYKKKAKEYYEGHKDKIAEKAKEFYRENKENVKEYCKKNKEKIAEQRKEYREKNREKINEYQRQRRLKLKEAKS